MSKNIKNSIILILIVSIFLIFSIILNLNSLTKSVYKYNQGIININQNEFIKLYNDDFNFINVDASSLSNIGYLNKNNYFKENIDIYEVEDSKVIFIDQFQDYVNDYEPYIYGGVYVSKNYYEEFLLNFDLSKYYTEISTIGSKQEFNLSSEESNIIRDIVLDNNYNDRLYDGVKQDLSEYSYDLNIPHKLYPNIYLKIRIYRTKNNDLVCKFNDKIYYVNEFKNNKNIYENASYYTYRGDDYGYLYNVILNKDDLYSFAFHDYIIENMDKKIYTSYVKDVMKVIDNEILSIKDKVSCIKQILYVNYKPTLREDFALKIERIKNLNIINDNRKTYRINHNFLYDLFNYPADIYSLAFYEDDLLYNIPERYKIVYENFVNLIINDPNIDYLKKNDMVVELENNFVVVDEKQLNDMRNKYGDIEVLDESNERIKYAPGYYGFLYDEINNIEELRDFALHKEVLDNVFSDYFREIYISKVNEVLESDIDLNEKIKKVMEYQLHFTLIPIDKQKYYRETYKENYFKESYIYKVKEILK